MQTAKDWLATAGRWIAAYPKLSIAVACLAAGVLLGKCAL